MSKNPEIEILFYDLDKDQEVDLNETQLLEANPSLSIEALVMNTNEVNGSLLNLEDGIKRIVEVNTKFEDERSNLRVITFKFQDKDKSIYK